MLKKIITGLLVIAAIALVAAYFMPREFGYQDSVQIDAKPEQVWYFTSSLKGLDSWSPWTALDPDQKQTFEGENGTIGSKNCWDSEKEKVGKGCQTITEIEANKHLGTELKFEKPNDGLGKAYVDLTESEGGTNVTWGFTGEMSWPMNIMVPMINGGMKEQMGTQWSAGLAKLKEMAEVMARAEKEALDAQAISEE